jgi:hypothetical protein
MWFIVYSMVVDAIASFLAYGRELEKFRLNRRIDGLFAKQPMLGRPVGKLFAVFPSEVFQLKGSDGWPEAETTVLPAGERHPSFGENQADESASNRENPPGPPIRTVPFARVSAASDLL